MSQSKSPHAAKAEPKNGRGPVFWLIAAVVLIAGGAWVVNFVHRAIVFEETDDAYISGDIHIVSSRLSESVTAVLVNENQPVKAGQILARLDPLASQIAVKKSEAALHAANAAVLVAQASLAQAEAEDTQAQSQVAVAEAQVQQASAQLELADVNKGRNEQLFSSDVRTIAKADVDATRSAVAALSAGLSAAKAGVAAAKARTVFDQAVIEAGKAQVVSAQARVEAEQEAVRDAQRELSYCEIAAPIDGIIGNKNVELGNRVQVGQALFALVEPKAWITANFKETQLKAMRPGQPVEITIDAIGGRVFTGKLDSISPASGAVFALLPPDNATGNFTKVVQRIPVKIVFDKDSVAGYEERLHPGLSAVISVRIK